MKKIICLTVLLAVMALFGCDGGVVGNRTEEPPSLIVASGGESIRCVVQKEVWDGEIHDRISYLDSALNVGYLTAYADNITFEFEGNLPDKLQVRCEDLDVTANKAEVISEEYAAYYVNNGVYLTGDIPYADGTDLRLFILEASWEENTASYVFVLRNPQTVNEESPEAGFLIDCESYVLSAEYDEEHSSIGGTMIFETAQAYEEFAQRHGVKIDGEVDIKDIFEENNLVVTYDYDSPTPEYLKPEVFISNDEIRVVKTEEYSSALDPTVIVRGYATVVGKELCEDFDIDDDSDVSYSWH